MTKTRISAIPPPAPPSEPVDGRYELLEIAGRGGMAVVWRGLHHGPGRFCRTVAVKQMYPHLAQQQLYRDLFYEEARIGSVLQDPNIAQVFDFLSADDQYYLVMEWVEGVDLTTYIRYVFDKAGRKTRWELMAAIGIGVLRGLAAAHERELESKATEPIVHRDVSPHNVLISEQGRAKLIDFGLSFARDRDIDDTDPGMAKGKLSYLAPEIVRGGRPTPASDQFAVGALLWEALVGRKAFDGDNHYAVYERVANAEVEPLQKLRPDVPKAFTALVHRALSLDPGDRYPDARDMARQLGNVLKRDKTKVDLYDALAETVRAARADLGIGHRTQDPDSDSVVSEEHSGLVELLAEQEDKPTGLRRWIPSFLRGRPE
ncbi:MAG: serine/threonine-protein kinase [Myxococcota bacterium]